MHKINSAPIARSPMKHLLTAFSLLFLCGLQFALALDPERRLDAYDCVLGLPDSNFAWLAQDEAPGATLACRDDDLRTVVLVVFDAPPGYHIDSRQGAAFELGMDRQPFFERSGSRIIDFCGVPCFEIRGRTTSDSFLTQSRMFAANGFLYNLQAMIPAARDCSDPAFEKLFAAFQLTVTNGRSWAAQSHESISRTNLRTLPADRAAELIRIPSTFTKAGDSVEGMDRSVQPGSNAPTSSRAWVQVVFFGTLVGGLLSLILLSRLRNGS